MFKYFHIFSLGLKNALEYRGALLTWILVELMTLTSAIFIWTAVFRTNNQVGTYNYQSIMLYYFLIPMVGTITTVHISEKLPRKIKDGDISSDLLKPYSLLLGFVVNQLAIKTIQNTIKIPIYLFVGLYIFIKLGIKFNPEHLMIGLGIAILGYILHVVLDMALSLLAFWFDDSWSLSLVKQVALMIFGGLSFPIDIIPTQWSLLFRLLPFDLIYYYPVSIMSGRMSVFNPEFWIKWCVWTAILFILVKIMWHAGSKKYCAYGQ